MMLLLGLGDGNVGLLPLDLLALALLRAIIRDLLFAPPSSSRCLASSRNPD